MAIFHRLIDTIERKQSNLTLAADTTDGDALIALAEELGDHLCMLKTHIDMIENFTPSLPVKLQQLAKKQDFLLFEDRKFADIGHTTYYQYTGGPYRIAQWADLVTVHALPGPGILEAIAPICRKQQRGVLLLIEMSSVDNLLTASYRQMALEMARPYHDIIAGVIAQSKHPMPYSWLTCTPGVKIAAGQDTMGQRYNDPKTAIVEQGSDIIIVGRGIIAAESPKKMAAQYQQLGWQYRQEALR